MLPRSGAGGTTPERLPRRTVLTGLGVTGIGFFAGCLPNPSSGGPTYDTHELDDGAVFEPGLQTLAERAYYAGLVTTESGTAQFDWPRGSDDARTFVANTDFDEAYLGIAQVGDIDPSMEFAVVDIAESDVNVTVVLDVDGEETASGERVITTLFVRVRNETGRTPDRISVELAIGDHHETFSGEPTD